MIRGTRKQSFCRSGAFARSASLSPNGSTTSSRKGVPVSIGVGRGDDVPGVEPVELLHVVEDGRELPAKALGLRLRQRKARQAGDVQHLFPRDRHPTLPLK